MIEAEARSWIALHYGPEKLDKLEHYVARLLSANRQQNLISKATEEQIWVRHIVDSAQLTRFASDAKSWLDIGSGAGLPGLVLGLLLEKPILLVEPRRKRVEFLQQMVEELGLTDTNVRQADVARIESMTFGAVTARAYAPLRQIFASAVHLTSLSTVWVLPKGRTGERELDDARQAWQGVFHVEHSLTDDDALIIVAQDVRPR